MFPMNYRTCHSRKNLDTRDSVKRTYQERVIKLIIAPYGLLVVLCLLQFVSENNESLVDSISSVFGNEEVIVLFSGYFSFSFEPEALLIFRYISCCHDTFYGT
jgi:hypothetical protein